MLIKNWNFLERAEYKELRGHENRIKIISFFIKNPEPAFLNSLEQMALDREEKNVENIKAAEMIPFNLFGKARRSQTLVRIHSQNLSRMANILLVSKRIYSKGEERTKFYRYKKYKIKMDVVIKRLFKFIEQKLEDSRIK